MSSIRMFLQDTTHTNTKIFYAALTINVFPANEAHTQVRCMWYSYDTQTPDRFNTHRGKYTEPDRTN